MTTLRETVSVVASEVQYEPRYSTWGAGRKITVLVAYSDESGQDEGPIAVLTAALLNIDSQWPPLAAELEVIEPVRHREIKGQALFKDLRNGRQCKRADSTLLKIISAVCDNRLPIFSGAVRRDWLAKDEIRRSKISDKVAKTTPYEMAFALCLHRIDMYVHTIFP